MNQQSLDRSYGFEEKRSTIQVCQSVSPRRELICTRVRWPCQTGMNDMKDMAYKLQISTTNMFHVTSVTTRIEDC